MAFSVAEAKVTYRPYPESVKEVLGAERRGEFSGRPAYLRALMDARLAAGYSREELAIRAEMDISHLTRVELGSDRLTAAEASALSVALQLPMEILRPLQV